MSLSPQNIRSVEFETSFRGYNRDEVETYLDNLALEVDELLTANQNLQIEVNELKMKIEQADALEIELRSSLFKQKPNETNEIEPTQKESNEIIREAELRAARIINRAKESANEIRNAVLTLREQKELIIAKLKAIIETQTGLFETKSNLHFDMKGKTAKKKSNEEIDLDVDDIVNKIL